MKCLTSVDDTPVYVNPAHVSSVRPHRTGESVVTSGGATHTVKGNPGDVVKALGLAASPGKSKPAAE